MINKKKTNLTNKIVKWIVLITIFVIATHLVIQWGNRNRRTMLYSLYVDVLSKGLNAYFEENCGYMATDFETLIAAGFASEDENIPNRVYVYNKLNPHGLRIDDFQNYKISWGLGPDDIVIQGDKVLDNNGNEILLVSPTDLSYLDSSTAGKLIFQKATLRIAKKMKEAAEKQKELAEKKNSTTGDMATPKD